MEKGVKLSTCLLLVFKIATGANDLCQSSVIHFTKYKLARFDQVQLLSSCNSIL